MSPAELLSDITHCCFPCHGCSTPARFTFRLLPLPARGLHLNIYPPSPFLTYAEAELLVFPFFWRYNTPAEWTVHLPSMHSSDSRAKQYKMHQVQQGINGFCLKSLHSNSSFFLKEKQGKKPTLLLHQNHLPAFLTSTHVVTIRTGLLGSSIGGMLNRHTGTHQNICELPKWNWHHGSGLYHTSEKDFVTQIKQFNSWVPCLEGATKCWAAYCYFIWLFSCGFQPVHFILQAQNSETDGTGLNCDQGLVKEQTAFSWQAETAPALSGWHTGTFQLLSNFVGYKPVPF